MTTADAKWNENLIAAQEQEQIQRAADALANAKAHYDRLLAHREDRLRRLRSQGAKSMLDMG